MSYDRTIAATMHFAPPGHFYSPHPLLDDIERGYDEVYECYETLDGINVNPAEQLKLFSAACSNDSIGPWSAAKTASERYFYENLFFRFGDATAIWHMAKLFRPKRLIEVGSGFSTACWLDSIDRLQLDCKVHCIEPYADRVRELCLPDLESGRIALSERPVQAFAPSYFEQLERNDVLFIDSTHVAKSGSDVNHLIFRVLPRLAPGVLVHFHDIFWPFEYPKSWYLEGRSWNECFLLRAFLQFNAAFRVIRFNSFLATKYSDLLAAVDVRLVRDAGASIWLVRE